MKVDVKLPKAKCEWCGKPYTKTHGNQKYCSYNCKKHAEKEQNRNRKHKWYHRNKHRLTEKQRYGLGTGTLGPHKKTDDHEEYTAIQKEKQRLLKI